MMTRHHMGATVRDSTWRNRRRYHIFTVRDARKTKAIGGDGGKDRREASLCTGKTFPRVRVRGPRQVKKLGMDSLARNWMRKQTPRPQIKERLNLPHKSKYLPKDVPPIDPPRSGPSGRERRGRVPLQDPWEIEPVSMYRDQEGSTFMYTFRTNRSNTGTVWLSEYGYESWERGDPEEFWRDFVMHRLTRPRTRSQERRLEGDRRDAEYFWMVEEWLKMQEGLDCSCLQPSFTAGSLAHHSVCPCASNLALGAYQSRMFDAMRSHFDFTLNWVVGGGTSQGWLTSVEFGRQLRAGWRYAVESKRGRGVDPAVWGRMAPFS
jgi:hypothetical protein